MPHLKALHVFVTRPHLTDLRRPHSLWSW